MDQLSSHHSHHQPQQPAHGRKPKKAKEPMIKYISSPMLVQANSASEFRAIVQQFTGQDSICEDGVDHEQGSWISSPSPHQASKADRMKRFSDDPVDVLDQLGDENNLWDAVAETLSGFQRPYVYV